MKNMQRHKQTRLTTVTRKGPMSDFPEQLIVTLLPSQKSTCSHCSPKTSKEQFHQVQLPQPASLDESQNSLQLGSLENMLTQRMEASWATASSTSCSQTSLSGRH